MWFDWDMSIGGDPHDLPNIKEKVDHCRVCHCTENNACEGGCSWIPFADPPLCTKCVSKNPEAKRIVGLREERIPKNAILLDFPCEHGYHRPKCECPQDTNGNYDDRLKWSEYNGFLWCSVCNADYPTVHCMPLRNFSAEAIADTYLRMVWEAAQRARGRKIKGPKNLY